MAHSEPAVSGSDEEPNQSQGLSQFISKVLDQLSLSAWLPAAMLVGCGAILVELSHQATFDLGAALIALAAKPLGILVVLVFATVLSTLVSQAFSFTAIRFLEGYWRGPLVSIGVYSWLIRRKVRKWHELTDRLDRSTQLALDYSLREMRTRKVPLYIVRIIEEEEYDDDLDEATDWTDEQRANADKVDWRTYCSPEQLGRISQLTSALADYPRLHRMMPTKLGNILRATEDKITPDGDETEGLMLRRGESVNSRLRQHHDQFRTRLDMYCTLAFAQVALALLTVLLLVPAGNPVVGTVVLTSAFLALAVTSYSAAISSARGYCSTLRVIFATDEPPAGSVNESG